MKLTFVNPSTNAISEHNLSDAKDQNILMIFNSITTEFSHGVHKTKSTNFLSWTFQMNLFLVSIGFYILGDYYS